MVFINIICSIWKSTKEIFQKNGRKRKHDGDERDIDEEIHRELPSKRKRLHVVHITDDNQPAVNGNNRRRVVFPGGGSSSRPAECSTSRHADISDDDSDIEFVGEYNTTVSRPVTYPDVEIISECLNPSTRYERNAVSRRTQGGLTFDHYARMLEACTPINRRSFVQNAYRTLPFASEPRQQAMRSVLLNGPRQFHSKRSVTSRQIRNYPSESSWYQQGCASTKAKLDILSLPVVHESSSTFNWKQRPGFDIPSSGDQRVPPEDQRFENGYLSAAPSTIHLGSGSTRSSATLDGQDVGESSERVSVAETSSSIASTSQGESQTNPPPKRCTSLEALEEFFSRSPLTDLNQKFKLRDPKYLIKSAVFSPADKARRDEIIKKLSGEQQLRQSNRLARHKSSEDDVRVRMRLEGLLIEDKELVEKEFIQLTEKQLEIVKRALGPGRPTDVLVEGFGTQITRRDIQTLDKLNWLNDEVINFFMNLIVERGGKGDGLPKVYAMITFFYPKLIQSGHSTLKRWTKKVDIFSYDLILVPIHLGIHWCLAVIDLRNKLISYYDSMGGANDECLEALLGYLQDECRDKKKKEFDASGWELCHAEDIPKQRNGSDCGMFACRFAECISRNAAITFTQDQMPYFRRRTVYEILNKCLL